MADQLKNSNDKRRHEDQKQNGDEEEPVNAMATKPEPKSITNINYDCLERIFDFLDLENLLNVAGTCKRLQIAAAAKFGDQYGKNVILTINFTRNAKVIRTVSNFIGVAGLKLCFSFLRCFGAKISILIVFYQDDTDTQNNHLDQYINQYCAHSLSSITIEKEWTFPIGNFPKPFTNMAEVYISRFDLENNLPNFVNLFPNLRHLDMRYIKIDASAIAVYFPHLEHLGLQTGNTSSNDDNYRCDFTNENAVNLLHANKQLKSFKLITYGRLTLDELLNMISENKSILKLVKDGNSRITNVNMVDLNRFASEHPLMEELILWDYRFTADAAVMFIRQLNSLKRFEFRVKDRSEVDRLLNQLDNKWQNKNWSDSNGFFLDLYR